MYLRDGKAERLNDALSKEKSIESFGIKKERGKKKKKEEKEKEEESIFPRSIYLTLFHLFLFNRVTRCRARCFFTAF